MTIELTSMGNDLKRFAHLFDEVGMGAIGKILNAGRFVRLRENDFVFRVGDSCNSFLLLLEGSVRTQLTTASGREVTLYRIAAGGSCVLTTSCLLGREDYPAEAIAETNVTAIAIPSSSFREALDRSPRFRNYVFDGFSTRLASVIKKIEELVFVSIDARLAAALMRLHRQDCEMVTHQELAVELGTAREVVSRHLKRFEKNGWIRLGRGNVHVLDADPLSSLTSEYSM